MATATDLWSISKARIASAEILLTASDWTMAAYMLGYAVETALKASACQALNLTQYPESTGNKKTDSYFMTHRFDDLLIISGMSDVFELSGSVETSAKWSNFVQSYPGEWVTMRYQTDTIIKFNSTLLKDLYAIVYEDPNSILNTIQARHKW